MAASTNMVFSEPTNKTGMLELFYDLTKNNSTSYTAYKYARDCNNALADYLMLAISAQGTWQVDDTNQTGVAEKSINIVSGTYKYPILTDDETTANQILDIERVECATESTAAAAGFKVLQPYNEMADTNSPSMYPSVPAISIVAERTITGVPFRYSKRGGNIYLDPTPNFSATGGLKLFISRTPTYFTGTDTTKVAGIPHAHQEYLVYRPAYLYCITNLPNLAAGYLNYVQRLEKKIQEYYSRRDSDTRQIITTKKILYI